jgi:hypothetical protein
MPDDLTKRGPHDRNRVSKQPHEQAYQKRKLPESTLVRREKSEILLKAAAWTPGSRPAFLMLDEGYD